MVQLPSAPQVSPLQPRAAVADISGVLKAGRPGLAAIAAGAQEDPTAGIRAAIGQMSQDFAAQQEVENKRNDYLAGVHASEEYYSQADALEREYAAQDLSKPGVFEDYNNKLGEIRKSVEDNLSGVTENGRNRITGFLTEAHKDYVQRGFATRQNNIKDALSVHEARVTGRETDRVASNPLYLQDSVNTMNQFYDDQVSAGLITPTKAAAAKMRSTSDLAITGIEARLGRGDFDGARELVQQYGAIIDPSKRIAVDRAINSAIAGYQQRADEIAIKRGELDLKRQQAEETTRHNLVEEQRSAANSQIGGLPVETQKMAQHSLDKWNDEPSVKQYKSTLPTIDSAQNAPDSAVGDQMIVTAVAKLSDPQTGVREGEVAAWSPTGLYSLMQRLKSTLSGGSRLTPEQRADLLKTIDNLKRGIRENYDNTLTDYRKRLSDIGVPEPERFLNPTEYTETTGTRTSGAGKAASKGSLRKQWDAHP